MLKNGSTTKHIKKIIIEDIDKETTPNQKSTTTDIDNEIEKLVIMTTTKLVIKKKKFFCFILKNWFFNYRASENENKE